MRVVTVSRGSAKCQAYDSAVDILVEFAPGANTFDAFMHLSFFVDQDLIQSEPFIMMGKPVIAGTRITVERCASPAPGSRAV